MPPTIIRIENIPPSGNFNEIIQNSFYKSHETDEGVRLTLRNKENALYELIVFRCAFRIGWAKGETFFMTLWTKKEKPRISHANCGYNTSRKLQTKIEVLRQHENYEVINPYTDLLLTVNKVYLTYMSSKQNRIKNVDLVLTTLKEDDQTILSKLEENKEKVIVSDTEESYLRKLNDQDFFLIAPLLGE